MTRLLLTGKNGQLGFELQRALAPLGSVIAVAQNQCDLSDTASLRALVRQVEPQIIVNAAAYTAVDKAESESARAMAVNAIAPGVLGEEAARLGALVVHYSTDYVFDGTKLGAYTEDDLPNPQNVYGASKWAGEQALQKSGARHLMFRTSWVVGVHGENFAKTILNLAAKREHLTVVADQFGAPTSAALLADVTALLLRESTQTPATFPYGLYHLTASGETSWHAYAAHLIASARSKGWPVKVAQDAIQAISTMEYRTAAKRPAHSRLDTTRIRNTFSLNLPEWTSGVDHILEQMFIS